MATNLVGADANAAGMDVVRKNMTTGAVQYVSADGAGTQAAAGSSQNATVSTDGNLIAFDSTATALIVGDANGVGDVFVKNMTTGAVTLISVAADGVTQGNAASYMARISDDGTKVVFQSEASNLVLGGDAKFGRGQVGSNAPSVVRDRVV